MQRGLRCALRTIIRGQETNSTTVGKQEPADKDCHINQTHTKFNVRGAHPTRLDAYERMPRPVN